MQEKGTAGRPVVQVSAKAGAGFLNPGNLRMMSGSEFAEFKKIAFANGSSYAGFTASEARSMISFLFHEKVKLEAQLKLPHVFR